MSGQLPQSRLLAFHRMQESVLFPTIYVCTLLAPANRSKSIPFSRHEHLDAVLCCTGCRTRGRRHIAETCPHFVVYIASTSLQMPRFPAHHLQQDSPFRGWIQEIRPAALNEYIYIDSSGGSLQATQFKLPIFRATWNALQLAVGYNPHFHFWCWWVVFRVQRPGQKALFKNVLLQKCMSCCKKIFLVAKM